MRVLRINGAGGVEIAIGFLRLGDLVDQAIDIGLEFWIRSDAQSVGGALDYFVRVGVVEGKAWRVFVGERFAANGFGGPDEILDTASALTLIEGGGNTDAAIGFYFGGPELIGDVNLIERDRLNRVIGLGRCLDRK